MGKFLTIAMDVDGTIIDKTGRVAEGVKAIFKNADLERTNFIFLSGGTPKSVDYAVRKINNMLADDDTCKNFAKSIKPYKCAYCGGQITDPKGNIIKQSYYSREQFKHVLLETRKADANVGMFFVIGNENYLQTGVLNPARDILNKVVQRIFEKKEAKRGEFGIKFKTFDYLRTPLTMDEFYDKHDGKISSIHIIPVGSSSKAKREILRNAFRTSPIRNVFAGSSIEMPISSKYDAINFILDREKNNPKYCDDISQVVYFGDGANDAECLEACNLSIARGEKAKNVAKQAAKIALEDCSYFADKLFNSNDYDMQIGLVNEKDCLEK